MTVQLAAMSPEFQAKMPSKERVREIIAQSQLAAVKGYIVYENLNIKKTLTADEVNERKGNLHEGYSVASQANWVASSLLREFWPPTGSDKLKHVKALDITNQMAFDKFYQLNDRGTMNASEDVQAKLAARFGCGDADLEKELAAALSQKVKVGVPQFTREYLGRSLFTSPRGRESNEGGTIGRPPKAESAGRG